MRKKWFPATLIRPQTVFTFDLLDTFHELTLQGKGNLFDFYHTLLRKTDNAGIEKLIVCFDSNVQPQDVLIILSSTDILSSIKPSVFGEI